MFNDKPRYNPDSADDISEFMQLLVQTHQQGKLAADEIIPLLTHLSATSEGRLLLMNCHRVASAQLPSIPDREVFRAFQWIQHITGMFARGGH